ncbi:DUF1801 domain-containing protein [Colwellia asteriadis]|uniref:DUF1801 domain-containing protein n=1 Tax=Colwellia asteriadis TaxID=517723 RepID=A0ABN1LBN9_9GAMM
MDLNVQQKFANYPAHVAARLTMVRELIFKVAKEDKVGDVTETLKWGEPSYLAKTGSTIRLDWKATQPDEYCIFFNCNTTLIETFKEIYGDTFIYQGKRALVFNLTEPIPVKELSHCLSMALRYKKIKQLPLLGA